MTDMNRPDLTILHKYMCACRALEVVRTGQVFFPCPSQFNDPFDCDIQFEHEIVPEEFVEAAFRTHRGDGHSWSSIKTILDKDLNADGTLTKEKREEILKTAREFRESNTRLGVLSLSEEPLSILMWAHYGKQHQGACVGFERNPKNYLGNDEETHPVQYSDLYPEARFAEIARRDGTLSEKVLFTKARDWSYEKEWRIMFEKGDQLVNVPGKVVQVILGLKTTPDNIEKFKTECGKREILVLQCAIVPGEFKLTAKELPRTSPTRDF